MYSCTTSGWSRPSSHSSASASAKTIPAILPRSTLPSSSITSLPKRSTSWARTSSSSLSSRCTISSLEMTAAPCRANAARASLLPAPMPPVMATAIGLAKLLRGLFGGSLGLGDRLLGRGFLGGSLGLGGRLLGRRLLGRRLGLGCRLQLGLRLLGLGRRLGLLGLRSCLRCRRGFGLGGRRLGEDLLREVEVRRALHGLGVVGALLDATALDALERQREAAPLRVDLDDLRADE